MALARELEAARRVSRQRLAELRLEEVVKVAGLADGIDEYVAIDRDEDLAMEVHFARLYQLADDEIEREAVVAAFMDSERFDKRHDANQRKQRGEIDMSVGLLKSHNPAFIEGTWVPDGSNGAA